MSILGTIKEAVMGGWLRRLLSRENLKQASTWKGLIRVAVAAGVITLSPETQDAVVTLILQIIAAGELAKGIFDVMRNENKKLLPWQEEDRKRRGKP